MTNDSVMLPKVIAAMGLSKRTRRVLIISSTAAHSDLDTVTRLFLNSENGAGPNDDNVKFFQIGLADLRQAVQSSSESSETNWDKIVCLEIRPSPVELQQVLPFWKEKLPTSCEIIVELRRGPDDTWEQTLDGYKNAIGGTGFFIGRLNNIKVGDEKLMGPRLLRGEVKLTNRLLRERSVYAGRVMKRQPKGKVSTRLLSKVADGLEDLVQTYTDELSNLKTHKVEAKEIELIHDWITKNVNRDGEPLFALLKREDA